MHLAISSELTERHGWSKEWVKWALLHIWSNIIQTELMNSLPGGLRENEQQEIRDALDQAFQISNFLKCGIDKNTLLIMIELI